MKHAKMFVVLVGILLTGFAVPAVAQAEVQASFTVSPQRVVVGEPVTVTSTTSNPDGYELTYKWAKTWADYDVQAGSPECLNADCSQARWTYDSPGEHGITLLVSWPDAQDGGKSTSQRVTVIPASEAPAPIILNGPTTVGLPTVFDVMSPKPHMEAGCFQPALRGSEWESCEQYFVKRTGPDAGGYYHYRFRLPMANPGAVELTFIAWNDDQAYADLQTFTVNVTGNSYRFGDVRSCYWPTLKNREGEIIGGGWRTRNVYELRYYAAMNSRVVVDLQLREGRRWVTVERQSAVWQGIAGFKLSPWTMRYIRAAFGPKHYRSTKPRRALYQIKRGKKILKKGQLTKKRQCTTDLLLFHPLPQAAE